MQFVLNLVKKSTHKKALAQCDAELEEFLRSVPEAGPLNLAVRTLRVVLQQDNPSRDRLDEALSTTAMRTLELLGRHSTHAKKRWTVPSLIWSSLLTGIDGRLRTADFDKLDRIVFRVDLSDAPNDQIRGSPAVREQICDVLRLLVEQRHVALNLPTAIGLGEIVFSAIDDIDPRRALKLESLPTLHAAFSAASSLFPQIQTSDESDRRPTATWTSLSLDTMTCVSRAWSSISREARSNSEEDNLPFCTNAFTSRCFICYDKIIPCIEHLLHQTTTDDEGESKLDPKTAEQASRAISILSFLHRIFLASAATDIWGGASSDASTFRIDQLVNFIIGRLKRIVQMKNREKSSGFDSSSSDDGHDNQPASSSNNNNNSNNNNSSNKNNNKTIIINSTPWSSHCVVECLNFISSAMYMTPLSFGRLVERPILLQTLTMEIRSWALDCECFDITEVPEFFQIDKRIAQQHRFLKNSIGADHKEEKAKNSGKDASKDANDNKNNDREEENRQVARTVAAAALPSLSSNESKRSIGHARQASSSSSVDAATMLINNNNTKKDSSSNKNNNNNNSSGNNNNNNNNNSTNNTDHQHHTRHSTSSLPYYISSEDLAMAAVRFRISFMRTLCNLHDADELKAFLLVVVAPNSKKTDASDPVVQEQFLKRCTNLLAEHVFNAWAAPAESTCSLNVADAISLFTISALVSLARSDSATSTERDLSLTSLSPQRIQSLFPHRVVSDDGARSFLCSTTELVTALAVDVEQHVIGSVRPNIVNGILLQFLISMLRALNSEVNSGRGESFASVLSLTCAVAESMRLSELVTCTAFIETQGVAALCRCCQRLCEYVQQASEDQPETVSTIRTTLSGPLNLLKMCAMSPLCLQMSQDDAVLVTDLLSYSLCEKDILETITNLISRFHAPPTALLGHSSSNADSVSPSAAAAATTSTSNASAGGTLSAIWQAMTRISRVGSPHERIWIKLCRAIMDALTHHPVGPGRESVLSRLCCVDNSEINIRRKRGLSVAVASPHAPASYSRTPGGFPFAFINVLIHLVGQKWETISSQEARQTFVDLLVSFTSTPFRNLFAAWDASVSWDWVVEQILLLQQQQQQSSSPSQTKEDESSTSLIEFSLELVSVAITHQCQNDSLQQSHQVQKDSLVSASVYLPELHHSIIRYLFTQATNKEKKEDEHDAAKAAAEALKHVLFRTFQLCLHSPEVRWVLVSSTDSKLIPLLFEIICNSSLLSNGGTNFMIDTSNQGIGSSAAIANTTSSNNNSNQNVNNNNNNNNNTNSNNNTHHGTSFDVIFKPSVKLSCQTLAISLCGLMLSEHTPSRYLRQLLSMVRDENPISMSMSNFTEKLMMNSHELFDSSSSSSTKQQDAGNNNNNNNSNSAAAQQTLKMKKQIEISERSMLVAATLKAAIDWGDGGPARPALLPKSSFLFQSKSPHSYLRLQLSPVNQNTLLGAGAVPPFWFSLRFCLSYHVLERPSVLVTIRHRKINARLSLFIEPVSPRGKLNDAKLSLYDDAADLRIGFSASVGESKTVRQVSLGIFRPLSWFHVTCAFSSGRIRLYMKGETVLDVAGIDLPNFFETQWDLIIGTRSIETDSQAIGVGRPAVPFCGQIQHFLLGLCFFEPAQARLIYNLKGTDVIFAGRGGGSAATSTSGTHSNNNNNAAGSSNNTTAASSNRTINNTNNNSNQQSSNNNNASSTASATTNQNRGNNASNSAASSATAGKRPDEELLRSILVCLDANRNFGQPLLHRFTRHEVPRLPVPPTTTWSWTDSVPFTFVVADGVLVRSTQRPVATLVHSFDSFLKMIAAPLVKCGVWPLSVVDKDGFMEEESNAPTLAASLSSSSVLPTTNEVTRAASLVSAIDLITSAFCVAEVRQHIVYNIEAVEELGCVLSSAISQMLETSILFREGKTSHSIPRRLASLVKILYGRSSPRPDVLLRLSTLLLSSSLWSRAKPNIASIVMKELASLPVTSSSQVATLLQNATILQRRQQRSQQLQDELFANSTTATTTNNNNIPNQQQQQQQQVNTILDSVWVLPNWILWALTNHNQHQPCRTALYELISSIFHGQGCSTASANVLHHTLADLITWSDKSTPASKKLPASVAWFPAMNSTDRSFVSLNSDTVWSWEIAREFLISITKILSGIPIVASSSSTTGTSTQSNNNNNNNTSSSASSGSIRDVSFLWRNIFPASGLLALRLTAFEEVRHEAMQLLFSFLCFSDKFRDILSIDNEDFGGRSSATDDQHNNSNNPRKEISMESVYRYFSTYTFDASLCFSFCCGIRAHFGAQRINSDESPKLLSFCRSHIQSHISLRGHESHLIFAFFQLLLESSFHKTLHHHSFSSGQQQRQQQQQSEISKSSEDDSKHSNFDSTQPPSSPSGNNNNNNDNTEQPASETVDDAADVSRAPIVFLSNWMDEDSSHHRASLFSNLPFDMIIRAFLAALPLQDTDEQIDELVVGFARIISAATLRSSSLSVIDSRLMELGDTLMKNAKLSTARKTDENNDDNNNSKNNKWNRSASAIETGRHILVESLSYMMVDLRTMLDTLQVPDLNLLNRARAVLSYVDTIFNESSQRLRAKTVRLGSDLGSQRNSSANTHNNSQQNNESFVDVEAYEFNDNKNNNNTDDDTSSNSQTHHTMTSPQRDELHMRLLQLTDERTIRLTVLSVNLVASFPAIVELSLAPATEHTSAVCESEVLSIILRLLRFVLNATSAVKLTAPVSISSSSSSSTTNKNHSEDNNNNKGSATNLQHVAEFGADALGAFARICNELNERLNEVKADASTTKLFSNPFKKAKGPSPAMLLRAKFGLASLDLISRCRASMNNPQIIKASDNVKNELRNFIGQDLFGMTADVAVESMLSITTLPSVLDDSSPHARRALATAKRAMALQQFELSATSSEEEAAEVVREYSSRNIGDSVFKKFVAEVMEELWTFASKRYWSLSTVSTQSLQRSTGISSEFQMHRLLPIKHSSVADYQVDVPSIGGPAVQPLVPGTAAACPTFRRLPSRKSYEYAALMSTSKGQQQHHAANSAAAAAALLQQQQQQKPRRRVKKQQSSNYQDPTKMLPLSDAAAAAAAADDDETTQTPADGTAQDEEDEYEEEEDNNNNNDNNDDDGDVSTTNATFVSSTPTTVPGQYSGGTYSAHASPAAGRNRQQAMFPPQQSASSLAAERTIGSWPCEVPFLMQCRSATVTLTSFKIVINFDLENQSYNPPVSKDAIEFLPSPPEQITIALSNIKVAAVSRRFRMRYTGVILEMQDLTQVLVCFKSMVNHDNFVTSFKTTRNARRKPRDQCKIITVATRQTEKKRLRDLWMQGEISNFEYLLQLNHLAQRSALDFSQYPIFPWVVSDYSSSKLDLDNPATFRQLECPIGLQGDKEKRESELLVRFQDLEDLGDIPFHYFTHYSTVAVVLFYLVRHEPFTAGHVVLQGGRFDHADRMFHSVETSWRGVTNSHQDVKELIPEFYCTPDFLINSNNVPFGTKQTGEKMRSVVLPKWAEGSPWMFVAKLREALECQYVTARLHNWIDLMFGYKQRGPDAVDACNLFHPDTYEGEAILDDTHDKEDEARRQIIDTLDNIGQCPELIFRKPHKQSNMRRFLRKSPLSRFHDVFVKEIVITPPAASTFHSSTSPPVIISIFVLERHVIAFDTTGTPYLFDLQHSRIESDQNVTMSSAAISVNDISLMNNSTSNNNNYNQNTSNHHQSVSMNSTTAGSSNFSGNNTTSNTVNNSSMMMNLPPPPSALHSTTTSTSASGTVAVTPQSGGGTDLVSAVPKFFGSLLSSSSPVDMKQQVEVNGAFAISNSVNLVGGAISSLLPPIIPAELLYTGRQADRALSLSSTLVRRSEREVIPLGVTRPNGVAVLATSDEKQIYSVVADDRSCVLVGLKSRYRARLTTHTEPITCMSVSSDHSFLATGGADCVCCVYAVEDLTGSTRDGIVQVSCSYVIQSHSAPITSIAISSQFDTIVTGDTNGVIQFHTLRRNNGGPYRVLNRPIVSKNNSSASSMPLFSPASSSPGDTSNNGVGAETNKSMINGRDNFKRDDSNSLPSLLQRFEVLSILILEKAFAPSVLVVFAHNPGVIYQLSLSGALLKEVELGNDCRFAHWCQTADPKYFLVAVTSDFGVDKMSTFEDVGSVLQTRSTIDLTLVQNMLPAAVSGNQSNANTVSNNNSVAGSRFNLMNNSGGNNTMVAVSSHPSNPQVTVAACTNGKIVLVGAEKN